MRVGIKIASELPEKLQRVKPPIRQLWYRGEWPSYAKAPAGKNDIFSKCVAVVGSRRMSRYGKQVLGELVPRLCGAGYSIVSGLMYGVDQEAHRLCLEVGGRAIAVLGYGVEYRSEEGAMKMGEQIEKGGGLILSEYPGETVCQRWMFPQRNRIVVGLADIVVIAEAGEKSGTLSTARWAQKMGKTVYAVPGSVFSATSEGANYLVAEGMAVALTKSEMDKLCGLEMTLDPIKINKDCGEVTTTLRVNGPLGVNELARELGWSVGQVLAELMQLEMKGIVGEERGVWMVKKSV